MSRASGSSLMSVAVVAIGLAPAASLFAARFLEAHSGPAAASGAATAPLPAADSPGLFDGTSSGYTALAQASIAAGFGADPFERIASEDGGPVMDTPEEEPELEPAPEFVVTSIAVSGNSAFAVLNGRLHRIGDEVLPGWRIDTIDNDLGIVGLRSDDGRSTQTALPRAMGRDQRPR